MLAGQRREGKGRELAGLLIGREGGRGSWRACQEGEGERELAGLPIGRERESWRACKEGRAAAVHVGRGGLNLEDDLACPEG